MLPYRDSRITQIALGIFFILIIGYAYFEGRGMLYGPSIDVPTTIQQATDPFILVKGTAERISSLTMDGKPVAVTEAGKFSEPYLLSPGLNRIILDAKDKYGRSRQEIIQVVYTPTDQAPSAAALAIPAGATSTATTTFTQ
jgi:hypothetical protein